MPAEHMDVAMKTAADFGIDAEMVGAMARSLDLKLVLTRVCKQMRVSMAVAGEPEPLDNVFSSEAFMPLVALQAQRLARNTLGLNLGVALEQDQLSLFGYSAHVPPLTGDAISVLRSVFFSQAAIQVFAMKEDTHIELLPLLERFSSGLSDEIKSIPGMVAEGAWQSDRQIH